MVKVGVKPVMAVLAPSRGRIRLRAVPNSAEEAPTIFVFPNRRTYKNALAALEHGEDGELSGLTQWARKYRKFVV